MEFKKIKDIREYAFQSYIGGAKMGQYAKFARIQARQGVLGEVLETKMANGLVETTNKVQLDEKTNEPDWIVTNPSGEQYLLKDSTFKKKYEVLDEFNSIYKPKGGVQIFIQIPDNISFTAPWGEEMNIEKGGYLNITDKNDIYGVQEKEFKETYAECDANGRFLDESLNYDNMEIDDLQM